MSLQQTRRRGRTKGTKRLLAYQLRVRRDEERNEEARRYGLTVSRMPSRKKSERRTQRRYFHELGGRGGERVPGEEEDAGENGELQKERLPAQN